MNPDLVHIDANHLADEARRKLDTETFVRRQIGANIHRIRNELKLNQTEVAEAMRAYAPTWNQTVVSRVERGHRDLRVTELVALGHVLGVDVTRLVSSEGGAS